MPKAIPLTALFATAAGIVIIDQITKGMANAWLIYGQPNPLLPRLNITLHYNEGAAFSFLSDAGGWQRYFFSVVAAAVSLVIIVWLRRLSAAEVGLAWSLALVLGGAVGNLIDRVFLGYVVDFISVHWAGWYFPTFNVADSAITLGAVGLIWDSFRSSPSKQQINGG